MNIIQTLELMLELAEITDNINAAERRAYPRGRRGSAAGTLDKLNHRF